MFNDQPIPKALTTVDVVVIIDNETAWKLFFIALACTVIGAVALGLTTR